MAMCWVGHGLSWLWAFPAMGSGDNVLLVPWAGMAMGYTGHVLGVL
jgi:hypothetical protein